MNNNISYSCVINRLEENKMQYGIITLQNNVKIIVSQYGGRIFGPFLSEDDNSILWMNKVFSDPDAFKDFILSGNWNLGGDRVWIAPEIQFSVRDRNNFWATLKTSDQVDPGNYTLTAESENKYVLSQDMQLDAYNLASGRKGLHIMRTIEKAEDPLRSLDNYDELIDGITFAGFEQTILLKELKNDGIMAEA